MKTSRTIAGLIPVLLVVLFVLAVPETFRAQNSKTVSNSTTRQSTLRTDKRKAQAKAVVQEFFDGVFVKRNITTTFERLVFFEACDAVDEKNHFRCVSFGIVPRNMGRLLYSRFTAAGWLYEAGDYFYILGTEPIPADSFSYPYSSSEYGKLEKVFKERFYSDSGYEGKRLTKRLFERKLNEIEEDWKDLEKAIFERIDKSLYKKNLDILKESMEVRMAVKNGRTYYGVNMDAFIFTFILAVRGGHMKIITLEDGI